jgi:hypothetical protein
MESTDQGEAWRRYGIPGVTESVASGSPSDRQEQWVIVVRRSFGISDVVAHDDAREILIRLFENELQVIGWQSAPRAVAQPVVDSLLSVDVIGDLSDATFTTRDRANRLVGHGIALVDPEHLVLDTSMGYPVEIVAAAQQMLERVEKYLDQQSNED